MREIRRRAYACTPRAANARRRAHNTTRIGNRTDTTTHTRDSIWVYALCIMYIMLVDVLPFEVVLLKVRLDVCADP